MLEGILLWITVGSSMWTFSQESIAKVVWLGLIALIVVGWALLSALIGLTCGPSDGAD